MRDIQVSVMRLPIVLSVRACAYAPIITCVWSIVLSPYLFVRVGFISHYHYVRVKVRGCLFVRVVLYSLLRACTYCTVCYACERGEITGK